jgi:hypothetical protein
MAGSGSRLWWIVAFFACVPLAACGDPAPEKSGGTKPAAASAPKKRVVAENMVAAVTAGKSATVVGVYFALGNAPTVDTALPIDVAIVPHQDFTSLQARFVTQGDGLTLISGDDVAPAASAKAESLLEYKLVAMPKKEGVFMVTVNLETEGSEGSVSRIFSIPVIVAPAGAAAAPAPAETPPEPATN